MPGPNHLCVGAGTALTTAVAARIPTSEKIDPVSVPDELDNAVLDQRENLRKVSTPVTALIPSTMQFFHFLQERMLDRLSRHS